MLSNKNANVVSFSKCCSFFSPVLTLSFCKALSPLLHSLNFLLLKYLHCAESWGTAKLWPSAATGFILLTQLYFSCLTVFQEDKSLLEGAKAVTLAQNYLLQSALHTNSKKNKLVKCVNTA